jgi:hypothetical protein
MSTRVIYHAYYNVFPDLGAISWGTNLTRWLIFGVDDVVPLLLGPERLGPNQSWYQYSTIENIVVFCREIEKPKLDSEFYLAAYLRTYCNTDDWDATNLRYTGAPVPEQLTKLGIVRPGVDIDL